MNHPLVAEANITSAKALCKSSRSENGQERIALLLIMGEEGCIDGTEYGALSLRLSGDRTDC